MYYNKVYFFKRPKRLYVPTLDILNGRMLIKFVMENNHFEILKLYYKNNIQ